MEKPPVENTNGWKKLANLMVSLAQYLTGEESTIADKNDAVFREVFPEIGDAGSEKRVMSRHRICIPATMSYGIAGNAEKTEVTNLNERGLFVYCSTRPPHGAVIQVELVLPPELSVYGRRRVRYHASVVRVEPQPSGQRFGVAAAIKNCEALPMENSKAFAAKV
jgi:hypothetical protein